VEKLTSQNAVLNFVVSFFLTVNILLFKNCAAMELFLQVVSNNFIPISRISKSEFVVVFFLFLIANEFNVSSFSPCFRGAILFAV